MKNKFDTRSLILGAALTAVVLFTIAASNTAPDLGDPTQYIVVSGSEGEDLQKQVNAYLKDGWRPAGGLTVGVSPSLLIPANTGLRVDQLHNMTPGYYRGSTRFCQAMVK